MIKAVIEARFHEKVDINPFGSVSRGIWSFRLNKSRRDEEFLFDSEKLLELFSLDPTNWEVLSTF